MNRGRQQKKKLVWYLLSSGLVGLIYMGILVAGDYFLTAPPAVVVTLAYGTAMVAYFYVNKLLIFKALQRSRTGREAAQFTMMIVFNYFITQLIVHAMHSLTGEIYSGSIVAGIVTVSLTYVVFDKIVFRKSGGQETSR